ncbi:MAG: hypothetical protein ACFCUI_02165 [Bernardetiaceae bacterium]
MDGLLSVYVATTIFGGGVIAVDMLGLLSGLGKEAHDDGGHGSDEEADEADHGNDEDDDQDEGADKGAVMMHDRGNSKALVLRSIAWLKTLVYFAFGFGATGWFALAVAGKLALESLVWGAGVGVVLAVLARVVKRLQRNEFDSTFKDEELLMERAEVIVPIEPGKIGKIRIHYNGLYLDRFARAENPHMSYKRGDQVRVVQITDEYFFVD